MRLLTHDNMMMDGDPVHYRCHDEPHGIEILECRPHPTLGAGTGNFVVARVRVRPWNVVCWTWLQFIPERYIRASYVRLRNQAQG